MEWREGHVRWRSPCALLVALYTQACSLLLGYPAEEDESTTASCTDAVDNDFDGEVDCEDPDCTEVCIENTKALCSDRIDNDGDNLVDCADGDCSPSCPENDIQVCRDGIDNDLDGRAGCNDIGCVEWCALMEQMPDGAWIDVTEVTRRHYEAWLASSPSTTGQSAECSRNARFEPDAACMGTACNDGTCGDHPQVCVDWCDARSFCQAVGKELCGRPEGGESAFDEFDDETKSLWFDACSSGGTRHYPYGVTLVPDACNSGEQGLGSTAPVRSTSACQPVGVEYLGVYDLVAATPGATYATAKTTLSGFAAVCGDPVGAPEAAPPAETRGGRAWQEHRFRNPPLDPADASAVAADSTERRTHRFAGGSA